MIKIKDSIEAKRTSEDVLKEWFEEYEDGDGSTEPSELWVEAIEGGETFKEELNAMKKFNSSLASDMKTIIDDVKKSGKAQHDNDEGGLQKTLDAAGINYLDSDNQDFMLHAYPLLSGSMILDGDRWIIDEVYDFLKVNNEKLFNNWKFIWEESTDETDRDEFWAERTKLIESL